MKPAAVTITSSVQKAARKPGSAGILAGANVFFREQHAGWKPALPGTAALRSFSSVNRVQTHPLLFGV